MGGRYPEQEARKGMLRIIREWASTQPDAGPVLRYHEFIELFGAVAEESGNRSAEDVYQQVAVHKNRYIRLVDEGYINARYRGEYKGGTPFTISWIRCLSERGLQAIEVLPDPQAQTLAMLDSIAVAIRALNDEEAPAEQKRVAERALNELRHFIPGLPPGVAIELDTRLFGT